MPEDTSIWAGWLSLLDRGQGGAVAVLVGSEVPASTAPTEARPAAKASQRSCWRSSPRARRNRIASETGVIGTVSNTTARRPGG